MGVPRSAVSESEVWGLGYPAVWGWGLKPPGENSALSRKFCAYSSQCRDVSLEQSQCGRDEATPTLGG